MSKLFESLVIAILAGWRAQSAVARATNNCHAQALFKTFTFVNEIHRYIL